MQNCQEQLMHQMVVLPFRGSLEGWRGEQRGSSWRPTKVNVKSYKLLPGEQVCKKRHGDGASWPEASTFLGQKASWALEEHCKQSEGSYLSALVSARGTTSEVLCTALGTPVLEKMDILECGKGLLKPSRNWTISHMRPCFCWTVQLFILKKRRLRKILSMYINTWGGGVNKTEPGPSEQCPATWWKATNQKKKKKEIPFTHKKTPFNSAAQKDCGASALKDVQTLAGYGPQHSALGHLALSQGGWMRQLLEVPSNLSYPVIPTKWRMSLEFAPCSLARKAIRGHSKVTVSNSQDTLFHCHDHIMHGGDKRKYFLWKAYLYFCITVTPREANKLF